MKTISKLFGVVAAIVALAACNKEVADVKPVVPEGMQEITIGVAQPTTKVTMFDNTGNLKWNEGEVIAAVLSDGVGNKFIAKLEQDGQASVEGVATFKGVAPLGAESITDLYYPYIDTFETAEQYANYAVSTEQNNLVPSEGKYDLKDILPLHWNGTGIYDSAVTLSADRTAMVKIDKEYAKPEAGKVKVIFDNTVYTINTTSDKDLIFLVDVPSGEVVNPYFRVNWGSATPSYMSTDGVKKLEAGKRYQLVYVDYGILPGVFSVSPIKKVYFSQGNLYYDGSKFNFEANQYGFNSGYQSTYVSHFCWSKDASVACAGTYSESGTTGTDVFFTNVDGFKVNVGGKEHSGWRTLSHDEWQYLFNTRTVNGGQGAGKSYSLNITYGGKMGLVLYPDDYTGSILSGTVTTLPVDVVFLPAAGYRLGSDWYFGVSGLIFGYYWSSTAYSSAWAYAEPFYSGMVIRPSEGEWRKYGYSVRLVTDAN